MNDEKIIQMNERGQVVIPKKMRDLMGAKSGVRFKISFEKGVNALKMVPLLRFTQSLEGSAKKIFEKTNILRAVGKLREDRS
jgi:bifunctional DNA-binding transcriptional regulator/antitoxin component of YhaV-PrlF toxin-antitoxin module